MKILVVSQYYYPEPFRVNEICEELVRRGHQVSVLTTNPNYPDGEIYYGYSNRYDEEDIHGVKVIRCKSRPRHKGTLNLALNYLSFVRSANKIVNLMENKYDIIYVYQLSPITSCIPGINYKKKYNIPMILYCLDIWPESLKGSKAEMGWIFNIFTYISKKIYKSADRIAVTSPSFINYISQLCSIPKIDIVTIYQHATDVGNSLIEKSLLEQYKKYINFMFIGNIGESQNLECLIRAVSQVVNRDKMRLHIVGSGSYVEIIKKLVIELGVENIVIFHGRHPKNEMKKYYAIADVCLVLLKDEGITGYTIPGKIQEYMSAGKTILACMNGDTIELINKAKCGLGVPANDDKHLANAIESLIEQRERFDEYGKNARAYYEENFTLKHHVDELISLMNKVYLTNEKIVKME